MRLIAAVTSLLFCVGLLAACQDQHTIEFNRYYASGAVVYQTHCQNCHGIKGEGLSALIPPLTDTVYLKANERVLACIIKNGLKGKISINGKQFESEMPAADLSPIETAQVITYITNSFGNKAGLTNLDAAAADLQRCK
jgi:mono/diheme cytochrome c family protein